MDYAAHECINLRASIQILTEKLLKTRDRMTTPGHWRDDEHDDDDDKFIVIRYKQQNIIKSD